MPYVDLPGHAGAGEVFELALGSPNAPRRMLREHGWHVVDPLTPTKDPWTYQRYLAGSKGEFTVAKHGYVRSRCGWFSERSAHYLASGRPVITQETGFSDWLPTGAGLFSFSNEDEVLAAIQEINRDHAFHCRQARGLVEEYFDSDKVLTRLLDHAMTAPSRTKTLPTMETRP